MPFLTDLEYEPLIGPDGKQETRNGEKLYRLTAPLIYSDPKRGLTDTAPAGYITDFATMPQVARKPIGLLFIAVGLVASLLLHGLWWHLMIASPLFLMGVVTLAIDLVFSVRGPADWACVIHDHMLDDRRPDGTRVRTTALADLTFRDAMIERGVDPIQRNGMYFGVHYLRALRKILPFSW